MVKFINGGVTAPKGFKASGVHCGIRKNKTKKDLALIVSEKECDAAAVYTQNLVYGAPITVTRNNIADGKARAVICNSGIANTCNADGVEKAELMCSLAADALNLKPTDFVVASTGVIGKPIDIEPIKNGLPQLVSELSENGSSDAAEAIMTTDTVKKEFAVEFTLGGKVCKMGAISKGSGMIHPNMATMLCFITTDANIDSKMLKSALLEVVDDSFNMLSIDGDTSTNDSAILLASGAAGNAEITGEDCPGYAEFYAALEELCRALAREIARDGEGATHLVTCNLNGAESEEVAVSLAKSVISSSLVKAAMFGADANWGRVICAMGYSGAPLEPEQVDISFASKAGEILVCKDGAGLEFDEDLAKKILTEDEIEINVNLKAGNASATAWGCDLTYDYVKINGDYRT